MAHGNKRVARGGGVTGDREGYWRDQVARWSGTGLSVRAYCEARGLSVERFYWWRRELARRDCPRPAGGRRKSVARAKGMRDGAVWFAEVKLERAGASGAGALEVVAGGRTIRVYPGFDAGTLGALVTALEGLGC